MSAGGNYDGSTTCPIVSDWRVMSLTTIVAQKWELQGVQVLLAWLRPGWQASFAVNRQRMLWGGLFRHLTKHTTYLTNCLIFVFYFFHQTVLVPFFSPNWYIPQPYLWCQLGTLQENTVTHGKCSSDLSNERHSWCMRALLVMQTLSSIILHAQMGVHHVWSPFIVYRWILDE